MKQGRKPLKDRETFIRPEDVFGQNDIPPAVVSDLTERNLSYKWLNAKKVASNNGYHHAGWQVYVMPESIRNKSVFSFGKDPDGVVRKGDLILGVKTEDAIKKHRALLSQTARQQKASVSLKAQEAEMRQHARSLGLDTKITSDSDDDS